MNGCDISVRNQVAATVLSKCPVEEDDQEIEKEEQLAWTEGIMHFGMLSLGHGAREGERGRERGQTERCTHTEMVCVCVCGRKGRERGAEVKSALWAALQACYCRR